MQLSALVVWMIACCAFGSASCANAFGEQVKGSGVAMTEARTLDSFDKLVVNVAAEVEVKVGPARSFTIEGDDNIVPRITTTVTGEKLEIGSEPRLSFSPKTPLRVTITVPSLSGLSVNGSGDASVTGLGGEKFAAAIAGSGDIRLTGGKIGALTVSISGSGSCLADSVDATSATISIAGSGDVRVNASNELKVAISGSGSVRYAGNPASVKKSIAGSGDVRPL